MEGRIIEILIGIDDTDNASSRGTGYLSRQLAHLLEVSQLASVVGITRHQLFVDPAIRYTSQNSSACLQVHCKEKTQLIRVCEAFLKEYSAEGSDAGLCLATLKEVNQKIISWGRSAKEKVLYMEDARSVANSSGIYLEGFTGNHEGIIGALAAVGLRAGGNDGRFIWRKGVKELRDIHPGIMSVKDLKNELELDEVRSLKGEKPDDDSMLRVSHWIRPVLKENKCILIVDKSNNNENYEWEITSKEIIRRIS